MQNPTPPVALVVDDEPSILGLMAVVLRQAGIDVLEARNGCEALETFDHWGTKIDLVITDVEMLTMSGLELAGRLYERSKDLAIIITSGKHNFEKVHRAFEFLPKPFTAQDLRNCVQRRLDTGCGREV